MESILKEVSSFGFNALRVPVSPQVFDENLKSNHHGQGKDKPLDNLTDLLSLAAKYNINVLLDLHSCNYKAGLIGSPLACDGYTINDWHNTLTQMTKLSLNHQNILGIDVFNEPHRLTWQEWKPLAEGAAKVVLSINPSLLIFVAGTANNGDTDGYTSCWGEYLAEAGKIMPEIPRSRLVFSPHTYGPTVTVQSYHNDHDFPRNMNKIWDVHFGYLADQGYVVSVGEFGGRYIEEKDKQWQDQFIDYLKNERMTNFFYWSLNPNSGNLV